MYLLVKLDLHVKKFYNPNCSLYNKKICSNRISIQHSMISISIFIAHNKKQF